MSDLVDVGAASRDPDTNTILVQAKTAQIGKTADEAPGFDSVPIFGQLGITAMPWPADERGNAQGVVDENLPGRSGAITGMRDLRAAGVVEEISPGETCVHSTGPGFDTRLFLKKQLWALMIGDDCAVVMDRENEKFTISCFGMHFEISRANGIVQTTGGATFQMSGPLASIMGQVVLGGRKPVAQVLFTSAPGKPVFGVPSPDPTSGLPAPGVFIGV